MQHDLAKLFEPDILAEPRFFQAHRMRNLAEPEKALLFAVLSEAVETYQKFAFVRSARGRVLFCQTESWIWNESAEYLFSFANICEVIGLDAELLRRGLQAWMDNEGPVAWRRKAKKSSRSYKKRSRDGAGRPQKGPARCRSPRLKGGWLS